jgi:hypothetical protein
MATALGRVINRRFSIYVHASLFASGAGLLLQAIITWLAIRPAAH